MSSVDGCQRNKAFSTKALSRLIWYGFLASARLLKSAGFILIRIKDVRNE